MIYVELRLDGDVKVYEMSDRLVLLKTSVETLAACLPVPETIEEAHEYLRAATYQLELFETMEHAETWAESFAGFRAEEVRAELARYQMRRASYVHLMAPAA